MPSFYIGIDTGGTSTDGVLLQKGSKEPLRSTKVPTTHFDLSICISKVLSHLLDDGIDPAEIARVSVSSTLATNAVVENRGARVGLIVIGQVKQFRLPVTATVFLKGGHTITGEEEDPLDLDKLVDTLPELRGSVDSYAVCAAMAMENPTHELVAAKAIEMIDKKPVFCSHEISSFAGMRERAATAALHAKLMPLMDYFANSLEHAVKSRGLDCPLVVVCGDASCLALEESVQRAALTVASGPAATSIFGGMTEKDDALVVDVGGTTTDVCLIKDGKGVLDDQGSRIGEWQTHVRTVDMFTAAGGGDSRVILDKNAKVSLERIRVQPLAMTSDLPPPESWLTSGELGVLLTAAPDVAEGETKDDEILRYLVENGPVGMEALGNGTGIRGVSLEKHLERLVYRQRISMSGFTPTDALHVLGELAIGDKEKAMAGARNLAKIRQCTSVEFCQEVVAATSERIRQIIIEYLARKIWGVEQAGGFVGHLDNDLFTCSISLQLPLVGIGAAAKYFLPSVAKELGTTVYFPDNYAVGNAIGAALVELE